MVKTEPDVAGMAQVTTPAVLNTTQTVYYPSPETMFRDSARKEIVNISFRANAYFLHASSLPTTNTARGLLFERAISTRLEEKQAWLALDPPDRDGAWKADLVIASYYCQSEKMLQAFDTLFDIYNSAPPTSTVWKLTVQNMKTMHRQAAAVDLYTKGCIPLSDTPTPEQLLSVRDFWVWYLSLAD